MILTCGHLYKCKRTIFTCLFHRQKLIFASQKVIFASLSSLITISFDCFGFSGVPEAPQNDQSTCTCFASLVVLPLSPNLFSTLFSWVDGILFCITRSSLCGLRGLLPVECVPPNWTDCARDVIVHLQDREHLDFLVT